MPRDGQQPAIARIAVALDKAVKELGGEASIGNVERWALLAHTCMSSQGRSFHDVEHALDVADVPDALASLAGLFHDAVYWQVDGCLPSQLEMLVGDAIEGRNEAGCRVAHFVAERDPIRALVCAIFGFEPGQTLTPYAGLNEWLSSLLAVRTLSGVLSRGDLAQLAAGIELTIPFRPKVGGLSPPECLSKRLQAADEAFGLGLGAEGIEQAVRRAVQVTNRDVINFAADDPGEFLDNTWKLLPESNSSLRAPAYTVGEYRRALEKMEHFMSCLGPERVFQSFRGEPTEQRYADLEARAGHNLMTGQRYLNAKVQAALVLEYLAKATGGDGPVALLMGDRPNATTDTVRLEDFLPDEPPIVADDVHEETYNLLYRGRASSITFDLQDAPLASFLYKAQGDQATQRLVQSARAPGADPLAELPRPILEAVIRAASAICFTRRDRLLQLLSERSGARGGD